MRKTIISSIKFKKKQTFFYKENVVYQRKALLEFVQFVETNDYCHI